jgi:hypothetical protein
MWQFLKYHVTPGTQYGFPHQLIFLKSASRALGRATNWHPFYHWLVPTDHCLVALLQMNSKGAS